MKLVYIRFVFAVLERSLDLLLKRCIWRACSISGWNLDYRQLLLISYWFSRNSLTRCMTIQVYCPFSKDLFRINFVAWCTNPIKEGVCLKFLGAFKTKTASAFEISGLIPEYDIWNPSQFISCLAKWQLKRFIKKFSSSSTLRHACTSLKCSVFDLPVTIKMSSNKQYTYLSEDRVQSIAFWISYSVTTFRSFRI